MSRSEKQICFIKSQIIMDTKTIFSRGNHFVEVESCAVVIKGVLKNYHIVGTEKYFVRQKTANLAANELLMQKCLPTDDYRERVELRTRIRNADKVVNIYQCLQDTEKYVKKWDGVICVDTKKNLLSELKRKLFNICEKYGFRNAQHAMQFTKSNNKVKTVTR